MKSFFTSMNSFKSCKPASSFGREMMKSIVANPGELLLQNHLPLQCDFDFTSPLEDDFSGEVSTIPLPVWPQGRPDRLNNLHKLPI
jgi:hypothetical protein